jgi:hypothetical protein
MRQIKKHFKILVLLFSILILFQGCTVYRPISVSLDEASKTETKARVIDLNGKTEKYSRIILMDDGQFYGKKKHKGNTLYNYILINEDDIQKIQLSNKKASTFISILVPVVIVGTIIGIMADNMFNTWTLGGGLSN